MSGLTVLGHVELARGDFPAAESLFERTRELAHAGGLDRSVAVALHNLGSVALGEGDLARAAARYDEAPSIYREQAWPKGIALCELYLGVVEVQAGRPDRVAVLLERAFGRFRELGFTQYNAQCLDVIAAIVHARGGADDAARLLGAASAIRDRIGEAPTVAARLRDCEIESVGADLGESAFGETWAAGRALSEPDALDLALTLLSN